MKIQQLRLMQKKCNIKFAVIGTEYNGVKGDANGDGKLRASDAAFIAKTLAEASVKGEKVTAENYPNADFNGDGKVTAADAAAIAKYLAEQSIKKVNALNLYISNPLTKYGKSYIII